MQGLSRAHKRGWRAFCIIIANSVGEYVLTNSSLQQSSYSFSHQAMDGNLAAKTLGSGDSRGSKRKRDKLKLAKNKQKQIIENGHEQQQSSSKANRNNTSLIPRYESCITSSIPLTKGHFVDAYSKGKWNLSNVPRPDFILNHGLMIPPDSYNESARLKATKKILECPQWSNTQAFTKIINKALRICSVSGASISLIDETRQVVKYCHTLSVKECPRRISIDGHAILSSQYFIILDASRDWRFENNPLVKSYPKIRLYAGVPLVSEDKQVVGILSIFDGFPRHEFDSSYIYELQLLAKQVMSILNSPQRVQDKDILKNDTNLINQIGRATSFQQSKLLRAPVYEKDGSGTPYSQNHNFRFSKHEMTEQDAINAEICGKLSKAGNYKTAAKVLSQAIAEKLDLDLIYIMEIRVAEIYKIESEFFPKGHGIEAENFKFANKLQRIEKEHVITRVINSFPEGVAEELDEPDLHYRALSSEFGIFIRSKIKSVRYKHGICMSFYRVPSKLIRKKKLSKVKDPSEPIDLYLKSGGYLIGAFSEEDRDISFDDVNYILNGGNIYRKMFLGNMQ